MAPPPSLPGARGSGQVSADGLYRACSTSIARSGRKRLSASSKPLPVAVARCNSNLSTACSRASLDSVMPCATWAVPAKVTKPARTSRGSCAMNSRSAACAASMRLGSTSRASMLRETSIASTRRRWSVGSVIVALGRARASRPSSKARPRRPAGRCRFQDPPGAAARRSTRTVENTTTWRLRRRQAQT